MHNGLLEKETKNLVETGYANSYMKNGKKDEYVYQDIYVNEEDNLLFYHAITMFKYLMQIKLNGGNFNNVPNADKSIILSLAMIDDMMGNYNHKTEFFFCDSKARRNIANKLVNFKSSAKIASYKTFENTQNK